MAGFLEPLRLAEELRLALGPRIQPLLIQIDAKLLQINKFSTHLKYMISSHFPSIIPIIEGIFINWVSNLHKGFQKPSKSLKEMDFYQNPQD